MCAHIYKPNYPKVNKMKHNLIKKNLILPTTVLLGGFFLSSSAYAQFSGVTWTRDYSNSPTQDKSGSGNTPSTSGATNNLGTYTFRISTSSTSGTQRQEWKYERRDGYMQMQTQFTISSDDDDFDRIALAQNHDDQTGSEGVFSIYQVRKDGDSYVFGVQGDTTEASNSYSNFDTVEIDLDKEYRLKLRSYVAGTDDSVEIAELYDGSTRIWREEIEGGGDVEGYYKIGVYKLTSGYGPVTASFRNTRFWTGSN